MTRQPTWPATKISKDQRGTVFSVRGSSRRASFSLSMFEERSYAHFSRLCSTNNITMYVTNLGECLMLVSEIKSLCTQIDSFLTILTTWQEPSDPTVTRTVSEGFFFLSFFLFLVVFFFLLPQDSQWFHRRALRLSFFSNCFVLEWQNLTRPTSSINQSNYVFKTYYQGTKWLRQVCVYLKEGKICLCERLWSSPEKPPFSEGDTCPLMIRELWSTSSTSWYI